MGARDWRIEGFAKAEVAGADSGAAEVAVKNLGQYPCRSTTRKSRRSGCWSDEGEHPVVLLPLAGVARLLATPALRQGAFARRGVERIVGRHRGNDNCQRGTTRNSGSWCSHGEW